MNVLILGNNEANALLEKSIQQEGFQTNTILDADQIVRFKGEPGAFICKTREGEFVASSVIITEPQATEGLTVDDARTLNLVEAGTSDKLALVKSGEKIVFLLDYEAESPEYLTAKAMKMAKKLADRKKQVYFLSRFVRTLPDAMELCYREAREAGVTFIKYDRTDLSFDQETGRFTIKTFDGVLETVANTPYLVSVKCVESEKLKKIAGKLKLSQHNKGQINEDRFFLSSVLTSRRGVFYFNPDVTETRLEEGLKAVMPIIRRGIHNDTHVVVDPKKCAFCYCCYRACPHGAMEPDESNSAMFNKADACEACGTCISICPADAIRKEVNGVITEEPVKPGKSYTCKVFCCENSAEIAFREISPSLGEYAAKLDVSSVPCGGGISMEMITMALATHGKVLIAVCMDDACRHWGGGKRACLQLERTMEMLKKAGIHEKQVKCVKVSHVMENILKENIETFLQN